MSEILETVLVVAEPLAGDALERWAPLIADAVAQHPRVVVADLRNCPHLDAAAITLLLWAHRSLIAAQGRLVLREPPERVRRTLRLARLEQVFEIEAGVPA